MNNKVIIIGGDHHNTLAVIRCLGKKKVDFKIIVHDSCCEINELMISHSKFSKNIAIVDDAEAKILDSLLTNKSKNYKQVIIPCSDLAEYTIDKNYNLLNDYYYISGFKNSPGKVVNLMNKYEQKKWADNNNIPMAKSWIITKVNGNFDVSKNITFPCIIKPSISVNGSKNDIHISYNEEDFHDAIHHFNKSNYKELIVQQFIEKKFEICAIGCITPDYCVGQVIRKIRENPPKGGGSLTYAKFIKDKKIDDTVNRVVSILKDEKYHGLYDIEFFVCDDCVYLNEINFRHSGNGYALIKSGILAPYLLSLSFNNEKYKCVNKKKKIRMIDDFNELNLLLNRHISIFVFIRDFLLANAHSIFSISDIGVFIFNVKKIISRKMKKNEKGKE